MCLTKRVAPGRRAGKLVERLEGSRLKYLNEEGFVDDFVCDFERQPGEELRDYNTRFNFLLRRFEEAVAGQVNPLIQAHVFLRKANLSAAKQSQIVSAATSRYEYEPLRGRHAYGNSSSWRFARECSLHRTQSGAYSAQVVETQDEGGRGTARLRGK